VSNGSGLGEEWQWAPRTFEGVALSSGLPWKKHMLDGTQMALCFQLPKGPEGNFGE